MLLQMRGATTPAQVSVSRRPAVTAAAGRRMFRNEGIGKARIENLNIPTDFTYGVELELFFPSTVDVVRVTGALQHAGLNDWRVKTDNSIVCNPNLPSCYKAEVVSPVLHGRQGLMNIYKAAEAIKNLKPSVNKTTGLHVHLKPRSRDWDLQQLRGVAYNHVQLESALDQLVPKSRRLNANHYCASNVIRLKSAHHGSKTAALNAIRNAGSIDSLKDLVCPDNRYYKLNLRALERHGTIEFRHAGGTANAAKVVAYVVMYLTLARTSAEGKRAKMPKTGYTFQNLQEFLSSEHVLLHWLDRRQRELNSKRQEREAASRLSHGAGHISGCTCASCRQ